MLGHIVLLECHTTSIFNLTLPEISTNFCHGTKKLFWHHLLCASTLKVVTSHSSFILIVYTLFWNACALRNIIYSVQNNKMCLWRLAISSLWCVDANSKYEYRIASSSTSTSTNTKTSAANC